MIITPQKTNWVGYSFVISRFIDFHCLSYSYFFLSTRIMAREKKSRCYYVVVMIIYVIPIALLLCGAVLLVGINKRSVNILEYIQ